MHTHPVGTSSASLFQQHPDSVSGPLNLARTLSDCGWMADQKEACSAMSNKKGVSSAMPASGNLPAPSGTRSSPGDQTTDIRSRRPTMIGRRQNQIELMLGYIRRFRRIGNGPHKPRKKHTLCSLSSEYFAALQLWTGVSAKHNSLTPPDNLLSYRRRFSLSRAGRTETPPVPFRSRQP